MLFSELYHLLCEKIHSFLNREPLKVESTGFQICLQITPIGRLPVKDFPNRWWWGENKTQVKIHHKSQVVRAPYWGPVTYLAAL